MSPAGSRALTGRRAVAFGVGVVTLEFASAVTALVVTTLLPAVADDLHAADELAVLLGGSTVGLFTAMAVAPRLLDRCGARPVLGVGVALTLVGAAWAARAGDAWSFAGGRFTAGLAGGLLAVFGVSAAIEHLDDRLRLRVIAASTAMWIVPGLVGPTSAVALEHLVGWRWSILLPVPFVLLGRLLVTRAAPVPRGGGRPRRGGPGRPRPVVRALLVPTGVAAFVTLTSLELWWPAPIALSLAVVGFAALMPPGTARLRSGPPAALASLTLFGLGYFGATGLLTLAVTGVLGASLAEAGWVLGAAPVAWALTTSVMPTLRDRGVTLSPAVGLATAACGTLVTSVLLLVEASYPSVLVTWTVVGAGVGAAYPTLYLRATTPDATSDAPALAAAVLTSETFGGLVGSTVGGALVSAGLGSGTPRAAAYGLAYLAFAVALGASVVAARRSHPSCPPPVATGDGEPDSANGPHGGGRG